MQVDMPVPTYEQGLQWLESQSVTQADWIWHYSGGAPTTVLQDDLDGFGWYQQWSPHLSRGAAIDTALAGGILIKQGMGAAIQVLQKWLLDLWLSCHQLPLRYHPSESATLQTLASKLELARLLAFQQQLNRFKMTAQHPLNQELQLEQLLLQYKKMFG
jgi:DNA polymerase-3 subunit delta'